MTTPTTYDVTIIDTRTGDRERTVATRIPREYARKIARRECGENLKCQLGLAGVQIVESQEER